MEIITNKITIKKLQLHQTFTCLPFRASSAIWFHFFCAYSKLFISFRCLLRTILHRDILPWGHLFITFTLTGREFHQIPNVCDPVGWERTSMRTFAYKFLKGLSRPSKRKKKYWNGQELGWLKIQISLILKAKFAVNSKAKFIFYDVLGQKTKVGCQNLTYDLFNRNFNS